MKVGVFLPFRPEWPLISPKKEKCASTSRRPPSPNKTGRVGVDSGRQFHLKRHNVNNVLFSCVPFYSSFFQIIIWFGWYKGFDIKIFNKSPDTRVRRQDLGPIFILLFVIIIILLFLSRGTAYTDHYFRKKTIAFFPLTLSPINSMCV